MIEQEFYIELKELLEKAKKSIYVNDREYHYSQDTLNGFCAIISYIVFKKYQAVKNIKFAANYSHCFLVYNDDIVIDLSPTQFNPDYDYYEYEEIETNFRIYDNENYLDHYQEIWLEKFISDKEDEIKEFLSIWEETQNPFKVLEKKQWIKELL